MRGKLRREIQAFQQKLNAAVETANRPLSAAAQIELSGNREAIVDGCRGVLQYEDTVIRLSTGALIVRFTGSDLSIRTMQQNQLMICGTILSVEFLS